MPSTHTALYYHLVFSTKDREQWFEADFPSELHAYLGGIIRKMDGIALAVGGIEDHVHLAVGLKASHTLADVMRGLKADSSKWIKRTLGRTAFAWQEGYGAFTVGAPGLEKLRAYDFESRATSPDRGFSNGIPENAQARTH
ncbi:IS200/IS605 family transposase [Verrucomicrobiaceae bacterium 227]